MLLLRNPNARAFIFTLVGLAALLFEQPATAQMMYTPSAETGTAEPAASEALLSGELSAEERRDLLARLSDSDIRVLLLQYLDAAETSAAAGAEATTGFIGGFEDTAARVRQSQGEVLSALGELPALPSVVLDRLTEGRPTSHLFLLLVGFAAIVLVGFAAEWFARWLSRSYRQQIWDAKPQTMAAKLCCFAGRLTLDFLGLGVFWLAAIGFFFVLYHGHEPSRWFVLTYLSAIVLFRVIQLSSRALLAPERPNLRMVPLNDKDVGLLHNRVVLFSAIVVFELHTASLLQLLGVDWRFIQLLYTAGAVVLVAVIVVTIWQARKAIAELIRGEAPMETTVAYRVRLVVAEIWHILAICYILVIATLSRIEALLTQGPVAARGLGSLLVVIALPLVDGAVRQLMSEFFAAKRAEQSGEEAIAPEEGYETIVLRAVRLILVMAGVMVFLRIWGVDVFALSQAGFGADLSRVVLHVGVTVLLAYIGWALAKTAIDKRLALEGGDMVAAPGDEGGAAGTASRLKTLLPLFRKFLFVTIVVMTVMIVLSSLGVQIGPLLAGAGVIGIAIGFGAQTLVRDVVSGVFFLLDDAFRMGEYVDVGVAKGTVERITVRSLVLRHHRGPLNIIPFGEIQNLTNFSRDWVIMKLQFRVTYDTDINKVKKIFKQIGAELMEHELLGPGFIEPLKSQGVLAMEDSAMILRAKFMAKPGQQFMIRKEVYRRVQEAFKEAGIEFAHREVTVHVPGVSDRPDSKAEGEGPPAEGAPAEGEKPPLSEEQAKAIKEAAAAAALGVLAEEEAEAAAKGGGSAA